ncbi:DUF4864 domain-containing protein [Jannaschia sp. CCS1]|uniref:DUF4864 domain-containing protein n=1 Tax=Jannaschia sp. (strain CCS1) TaxID=290400 RepID=UPI000053B8A9|nr:DUF4864 domain-containing protein [Jannaschia sp. CCS1]ABD56533.1 hypothetical protein Jann_3616 [Jannaschia sp. CCS1]
MSRAVALSVFLALSLAVVAAFVAPRPVAAQEVLPANPDIEAVIGNQFDAFREGALLDAWQYASPNIQGQFGDVQNFGRMVEQAFPMVWQPGEVDFIDLQTFGAIVVQRVEVVDQAGNLHYLGYAMVETDAGWRINGVQILRAPSLGA